MVTPGASEPVAHRLDVAVATAEVAIGRQQQLTDPGAVDVAFLDDDVADVDADAERDALVRGQVRLALGDAALDRRGALDRIDHARELDQRIVAHQLHDPAVVLGDFRLDEVLTQRREARVGAFLVSRHQPRVADDIGGEKSPTACAPYPTLPDGSGNVITNCTPDALAAAGVADPTAAFGPGASRIAEAPLMCCNSYRHASASGRSGTRPRVPLGRAARAGRAAGGPAGPQPEAAASP